MLPAALAAACREEPKKAAQPGFDLPRHAHLDAEQTLRAGPGAVSSVELRGVQVYPQAMPREFAVCGQVNRGRSNGYTFFVSIVSYDDASEGSAPAAHVEQYVANTIDAATRVWTEMIGHCYENGGPPPLQRPSIQTLPPMPNLSAPLAPQPDTTNDAPRGQPATRPSGIETATAREPVTPRDPQRELGPAGELPAARTASGTMVMRQNGNLHAAPGGGVLRVVPRNTELRVFAEAAGGWYQVGDDAPWGWIHRSMVDRRP